MKRSLRMWGVMAMVATSVPAGADGQVQTHDLEVSEAVDQDWMFVRRR